MSLLRRPEFRLTGGDGAVYSGEGDRKGCGASIDIRQVSKGSTSNDEAFLSA